MVRPSREGILRLSLAALIALTVRGGLAAADEPPARAGKAAEKDNSRLRGRWSCRTGAGDKLVVTWEFADGKLVMTEDAGALGENYGKQVIEGTFTLRAGTDPAEIDVTLKLPGSEEVPPLRGIYALDGDRLKLCYGRPGSPRPARFPEAGKPANPARGEEQRVLEFRRVKD